ncbi:MAG: lamin tail domain-containing protein [Sphingobacteriaceae bacterium]
MKKYLLIIAMLYGNFAFSQLNEAFNDDDFTSSPSWSGNNSGNEFSIIEKQLRSNSLSAAEYYLSTPNTLANNCQWEFWVNLQFNPSNANYVDIYLISDQTNLLSTNINGYFIRLGNTEDEICLYKRSGATSTKIIDGDDGVLNKTNNKLKIRVTRTDTNFTLEYDATGLGTSFVSKPAVYDASHTTTAYFGIYIKQSSAASVVQKHFFDDFQINSIITDTTPPKLSTATVIDSSTLELTFDEPIDSLTAKNLLNYSINNSIGNPTAITTTTDASKYSLKLASGLNTATYTITTSGIKDIAGNLIATTNNTITFSYIKPFVAKKGDLVINEIFADPSPQIDLPSVEFIEIYNTTNQTIQLKNWKYADQTSTANFPIDSIKANEYLILCAKADTNEYKSFGKTIGLSPWPSLNNSTDNLKLISPESKIIDSIAYSDTWYPAEKKQGGWTLEKINYKSVCRGLFNWMVSSDITGGTPGRQNSIFIADYDALAFETDSISQLSDTTLVVYFNKSADKTTASNAFNLNPVVGIKSTTFSANAKQATLTFNSPFSASTLYQLSISQLKDCAQNSIASRSFQFTTPAFPPTPPVRLDTAKIYITEIFADPSPEIQLPLAEFVEIYNPGKDTVDLDGWTLSDPVTNASITNRRILPEEYVILCPAADTLQYKLYGKVIGLTQWPSLNNSSDKLYFRSFKGRLVDSLSYSDTWHASSDKKQGGWSLEKIDYISNCKAEFLWTSSTETSGGTPGRKNSVHIPDFDKIVFKADSLNQSSDSTVTVYFNKPPDASTFANAFNLNPASATLKSLEFNHHTKQATLLFDKLFLPNTSYQLLISNLKDCAGNDITADSPLTFTTPQPPPVRLDTAKLYITEIFADPSPEIALPLAEFIEIYNPGKDTIDLEAWTVSNSKTKIAITGSRILPNQYLILCPIADTLLYKSQGKVTGLSPWPTLTNIFDKVVLKSFKGRLIDSISYSDTWHSSSTKRQGGWSLERVDYKSVCEGLFNWTSSSHNSGGTPGKLNSVQISNYDQLPFKADSIKQPSDSTLIVYFNKHTDISTAANAFNLQPAAGSIKSVVFNTQAVQASLTFSDKFTANTFYELNITQLKDCSGNVANATLNFTTPKLSPARLDTAKIFITEIFADPSPEINLPLTEFIEIYNPGKDTIDLDGWAFSNSKTQTLFKQISIHPGEFIILCPSSDTSLYTPFGKVHGLSPWPSLTNTSDKITLKSFKNRLVDSVAYSDSWHTTAKKQGGWSLERVDYQSMCKGLFNWKSSVDASGGTPGRQNSVHITNYDGLAFKADSIKQLSDSTINIFFNKHADISTAANAFNLQPITGSIKSVEFDAQALKATLLFSDAFAANTRYELAISQLKDCSGNEIITPSILTFTTPKLPPVRLDTANLYITEIFADPSPEIKLPLVEFVEIYNHGKDTINLDGWTLHSSNAKTTLKKVSILPYEYLIFCPIADTLQYQALGRTVGLSPWPTLTNSTGQVYLKSFKGRLVDSIVYSDSWHSLGKKQGGWSLERIDYLSACSGAFNWLSSSDITGGTPGKQNSIYIRDYDKLGFQVDSIQQLSDTLINVFFNKPADISTATNAFNLTPGSIKSTSFNAQVTKVTLHCDKFQANTQHKLIVAELKDCAGNEITSNPNLVFTTPKLPPVRLDTANLYITEIFADPSPEVKLPLVEFVEIYNPGKDTILLDGWTLNTASSKGTLKTARILPQEYLIIAPDTLLYKPFGKTVGLSTWPTLPNSSGQIILKSFKGRTVDSISYKDSWYKNESKKSGGWSLELIDKQSVCNNAQNWIASKDASGGTPGRQNSVYQLYNSAEPLKLTKANLMDSITISLTFNRPPDSLSATRTDNYFVNNGVGKPSVLLIKSDTLAELKFNTPINRGKNYRIEVINLTDCTGKSIQPLNNFAELFYPEKIAKNNILITEILFNPRIGGADFVEIYNNSVYELDLKELSIASIKSPDSIVNRNAITTNTLLFKPKQYLVLSTDPENIKQEYHTENPDAFLKMSSVPAFNNDAGSVVLLSNDNRIDQFNYHDKMHFALIKDPKGISLERSDFNRPANDNGNFRSAAASVGYATPGYKNSQAVEENEIELSEVALLSKTFSPDNDGFEDALQINYSFKDAGMVANATIYNDKGILIKRLVKNTTLAANGTFVWDGMNENEQMSPIGVYIIYLEAFNLKGESKKYRKAFVLAAKF